MIISRAPTTALYYTVSLYLQSSNQRDYSTPITIFLLYTFSLYALFDIEKDKREH